MQTKSRNGKFNISITTKTNVFFEDDDNEINVEISPVKGEKANASDFADTFLEAQNMVEFLRDL